MRSLTHQIECFWAIPYFKLKSLETNAYQTQTSVLDEVCCVLFLLPGKEDKMCLPNDLWAGHSGLL